MSMNSTPASGRLHIGFFGRRNAGKSSLVNAFTGQSVSVVSNVAGTTTDPVKKAMELLPLGPVMIVDTPGFDDEGLLGELRIEKTKQVLATIDIAVLVCDIQEGLKQCDNELISIFKEKNVPYVIVYNKADLKSEFSPESDNSICVSALNGDKIYELKEKIAHIVPVKQEAQSIVGSFLKRGEFAVLVTPIDSAAPKGRMILPQQQVIRDVLEVGGASVTVQVDMLDKTLSNLKEKAAVVITDSQAFEAVSKITPKDIKLTSFSILMANYKGFLETAVKGVKKLDMLKDGDKVLIAEGCTHHRQCDDIGSVKLPRWIGGFTGKKLDYTIVPGHEFPEDLSPYAVVIHCGGCMITEREVKNRMEQAVKQGVAFTNYGITIAHIHGILARSLEVFPNIAKIVSQ
ncbi:MAG: [FeFe] hydrogenase H-cluster maturation GTPase HydF [Clostridia bacterium]|nr:[FeFe] hydrogenase H-cluster maturation GTPase HydF [Clostridia bacterium]